MSTAGNDDAPRNRERGELEDEIMKAIWAAGGEAVSTKAIQEAIPEPTPAYTTVLTVLDRLETKGLVERAGLSPRKMRFRATSSRGEHAGTAMLNALRRSGDHRAALLNFAGDLDADDLALLREVVADSEN